MKTNTVIASLGWLCLLSFVSLGQERPAPGNKDDKARLAAEHMELSKAGEEHHRLEALAGTWDKEIKVWSAPGASPITLKATTVNTMILGGRFLKLESKGDMGYEGLVLMGFDRRSKRYTQVGYDSFGTYYVTAAGTYDPSQNAIVMYGEDVDPMLGTQKYNFITRFVSPTKYVTEVIFKDEYHTKGRGDFKAVEVTSTKTSSQ